ncbi:MAG: FAD-dependent oxidoreductase, partial [Acidimicrobiia bacterium]
MTGDVDVLVVGGGIVGLATARALARGRPGLSVRVLEKESEVGRHQTGHNSGVLHSGLYYRPGSNKARLCVEGRREMLEFCDERGIPIRVTGKLVIATTSSEEERLDDLADRGRANGLAGLERLGP